MAETPSLEEIEDFHRQYPAVYAVCRTFKHGPEKPYSVERPPGRIEVTRVCACGRRVTRVYTPNYVKLVDETRVAYPRGYLAPKGSGGVDKPVMAEKAITHEQEELHQSIEGATRRGTRSGNASARKSTSAAKRPPKE